MPKRFTRTLLISILLLAGQAMAAPPETEWTCRGCHGQKGVSSIPIVPNLACQQEQYLINALLAYRDGRRIDASMSAATNRMLTSEIEALAAYYAHEACPK